MRRDGQDPPESSASYLGRLTQAPLLSKEEEVTLSRAAQAGDAEARARLIESNMRLVVNIARSYINSAIPLEDLIQEGALGLMRAVERFDPDRGYRFSTYATHWIRQAIRRALDCKAKTIRLPAHVVQLLRRMERERDQILAETGEEPSAEQMSARLGISKSRLKQIMQHSQELVSLDLRVQSGEGTTLGSMIADDRNTSAEELVLTEEFLELLEGVLDELSEREQMVLRSRLDTDQPNYEFREEMSKHLRISRERVRQIESVAIKKLRLIARQSQLGEIISN